MDFSGHAGRVIENPREALSVALEEAHAWRVRPAACVFVLGTHSLGGIPEIGGRKRGRGRPPGWGEVLYLPEVLGNAHKHTPTLPYLPLLHRRRQTTASACLRRPPARASVQVRDGPESWGRGCLDFSLHSQWGADGIGVPSPK